MSVSAGSKPSVPEKCFVCGAAIDQSKTPYLSKGRIVCSRCHARLNPKASSDVGIAATTRAPSDTHQALPNATADSDIEAIPQAPARPSGIDPPLVGFRLSDVDVKAGLKLGFLIGVGLLLLWICFGVVVFLLWAAFRNYH